MLKLIQQREKLVYSLLFLLCVSMIISCGTVQTATPAPQQPSPEATHPFHGTVTTLDGDFIVTLDVTPNLSGTNVFLVHVEDAHTNKLTMPVAITLYTTMQDMDMGTDSLTLHPGGSGLFSATADNLSMAGHWAIGIVIQTSDHVTHKAGVSFVLSR